MFPLFLMSIAVAPSEEYVDKLDAYLIRISNHDSEAFAKFYEMTKKTYYTIVIYRFTRQLQTISPVASRWLG